MRRGICFFFRFLHPAAPSHLLALSVFCDGALAKGGSRVGVRRLDAALAACRLPTGCHSEEPCDEESAFSFGFYSLPHLHTREPASTSIAAERCPFRVPLVIFLQAVDAERCLSG